MLGLLLLLGGSLIIYIHSKILLALYLDIPIPSPETDKKKKKKKKKKELKSWHLNEGRLVAPFIRTRKSHNFPLYHTSLVVKVLLLT